MRISRFHANWLFAVLGGLATLSTVGAEDKPADSKPAADAKATAERETLFKQLDKNSDGVVAADEVGDEQKRLFNRLLRNDKNEDGKLSLEEWLASTQEDRPARRPEGQPGEGQNGERRRPEGGDPRQEAETIFKRADANGDGKVVLDEVPEDRRERFAQMIERADSNGDKALTLEEFTKGYVLARSALTGNPVPPQGAGGAPGEGLLRLFDADGDGKLSKAETAAASEVLKKFDRNEDGDLSREELNAGIAAKFGARPSAGVPPGARFGAEQLLARWKEADKNGDGKWSKDEVPERAAEHFARIDANGDGVIDEAELKKMAEGFAQMAEKGGEFMTRMFEQADVNKDGKLSKDEAPERLKENFDRIDRNGDGFVDRDELRSGIGDRLRQRESSKKE